MKAIVIPVDGPFQEVELAEEGKLDQLQSLVGGWIEAVPIPSFVPGADHATAYINEEGKLLRLEPNMAATDFMVPGVGLLFGDYIAGPMVVCGFDPATGEEAELPKGVLKRVRLIAFESGKGIDTAVPAD